MEPWRYRPVEDLGEPLLSRLRRFPREPDMMVYGTRLFAAGFLRGWLRLYHRLQIRGRENLPSEGSFIMVANHASHLDALCLLSALPLGKVHRAFPAAAEDYFFLRAPGVLLSAVLANALPFDRRHRVRQSLGVCRRVLEGRGNILVIFPEGTRSPTSELAEFKPGVGWLVAGTDHAVVPCWLKGTERALPRGALLPRPARIELTIGRMRSFADRERSPESARRICRELRQAVEDLAQAGTRIHAGRPS